MNDQTYGGLDPDDPEFDSVEDFVEYLLDDERDSYDWRELRCMCFRLGLSTYKVRRILEEEWGLTFNPRQKERKVRGFLTNSNDRWYGPGACRSHGGSGWEQVSGFAGQEG